MKKKTLENLVLSFGIVAMIALVVATFLEGGSLVQKIIFLVGALVLFYTAYFNKQQMFVALQAVIIVGTILGFFPALASLNKYIIMGIITVISVANLIRMKHYRKDPWGVVGSLGLLSLALGFATDAVAFSTLFYSFLATGGILVAIYSAIGFFYYKIRITMIWLILNVVFAINPIYLLITG
jgi:hypothetical protein